MIYRVCTSELLGYQTKIGSILSIIFLIPASLMFHNPIADPSQINAFLKNIGLIGGLSILIYAGSGALSIDGKMGIHKKRRGKPIPFRDGRISHPVALVASS